MWQASQRLLETIWVWLLPLALVPLWQLTQLFVMPACVSSAGVHAIVVWQSSQLSFDR
mgnify:CR=1 FL=1